MTTDTHDLTRIVLVVLFIAGLIAWSFWVLCPFLLSIAWATTIVVATCPLMLTVEARLGQRRGAAVAVMLAVMLLAFVLPLAALPEMKLPWSPEWAQKIPLSGARIAATWDGLAAAGTQAIFVRLSPHTQEAFACLLNRAGGLGSAFAHFLPTVGIAGILYANGETRAWGLLPRFVPG